MSNREHVRQDALAKRLAEPKSASLRLPLVSIRMFLPLMSRCTTWFAWQ